MFPSALSFSLAATVAVVVLGVDGASLVGSADASIAASTGGSVSGGWGLSLRYESANCSGTPVELLGDHECIDSSSECALSDSYANSSAVPALGVSSVCVANLPTYLDELFGDQTYLRVDLYNVSDCSDFLTTDVLLADGLCHAQYMSDPMSADPLIVATETTINADGTASVVYYDTADCSGEATSAISFSMAQLAGNECNEGNIAYTNFADSSSGGGNSTAGSVSAAGSSSKTDGASSLSMGAIAAIVNTCAAFLA